MSGSNILSIVDYTASVAATISGIKAVFGSGTADLDDPLRTGQTIRAAGESPAQPFEHWSEIPGAPGVARQNQDGDVWIVWTVPMRLWLQRADLASMRKVALPFYSGYLAAFVPDQKLGGFVLQSRISLFAIGEDGPPAQGQTSWGWLDVHIECTELVRFT